MIGLLVGGMFLPPDLPKVISEKLKSGVGLSIIIVGGLILGVILLISSGLFKVFAPSGFTFKLPSETISTIGVVLLLLGAVIAIIWGAK
jgi:hypothetical protein